MTLPNFLVIGAAKAGTTSLRHYLDQHPDVFVTRRGEPSFFAHEGGGETFTGPGDDEWTFVTDRADYAALFAETGGATAVGEISPRYLYFPEASARIARDLPQARLIAILRHPVDRAYSHFLMNKGRDCEPAPDLATAMDMEDERLARGWGWDWQYVGAGCYHRQLERYYRRLPAENLKVFLYDDLQKEQGTFFEEMFSFLGVDPSFRPDTSVRRREAGLPRSYGLQRVLDKGRGLKAVAEVFSLPS